MAASGDPLKWTDALSAWSAFASAVVAFLALVAAGIAAVIAWHTYRKQDEQSQIQAEQLRQLESDRRRAFAAQFSLWSELTDPQGDYGFRYHNGSGQPVYVVSIICTFPGAMRDLRMRGTTLGPTTGPRVLPAHTRIVDSSLKAFLERYDMEPRPRRQARLNLWSAIQVTVTFRDVNGVYWQRNPHFDLRELDKDPMSLGQLLQVDQESDS
ncbi:MAG TPA: hypothetical protein VL652_15755 [Kutzneria sp.]|nr:hypothetical protein [Kutzneria sp.]